MPESKRTTFTEVERPLQPDDIGWDPDDAPELDEAWFIRADRFHGSKLVERGYRPGQTERLVLPTPIVERFRASGPDWQIRIETALEEWLSEHPDRL